MPDISDLYDYEIAEVGQIWKGLMTRFSRLPNTKANLQKLAEVANDEFIKAGFVVNVRWENNLVIDPKTMQPYPIEIEVIGRLPGAEEDQIGFDHERKRAEVLQSKDRGESFAGQKERNRNQKG
jgi:hypothetical protein